MRRFETPQMTVKEFSMVSVLAASETANMTAAKEYLAEKDIKAVNIVTAVIK